MKYLIILSTLLFAQSIFAQKSTPKKDEKYTTLWVENKDVILQGTMGLEFASGLFVGQEYTFTIITNNQEFDLRYKVKI